MTQSNPTSETRSVLWRWLVGGIVLLMIVLMVYSGNPLGPQDRAAPGTKLGSASGGSVMSQDVQYAGNLYDALQGIAVVVPVPSAGGRVETQVVPLLTACWGDALARDVKLHPEALFLVLRESRAISPGVSPFALGPLEPERQSPEQPGAFNNGYVELDQLRPLPTSPLGEYREQIGRLRGSIGQGFPVELRVIRRDKGGTSQLAPNTLPPLEQANVYAALSDFLTIQSAASLPLNALKPSTPMVERLIASRAQAFTLELGAFDAAPLLPNVGEPNDEQLAAQLKAFADRNPGQPDRANPFGFGYRVPDRVKLQLISLRRDDVRKLVEAEKTAYEWDVAARVAFAKDPTLAGPTTASTTGPATAPTAAPAARFEDARDRVIATTIDRAVDARLLDIERAMRLRMAQDYQTFNAARATGAATQPTALGVRYDAADYLDRLAAEVARTSKVTPVVEHYDDRLRDAAALTLIGGFNQAARELPLQIAARFNRQTLRLSGPEYAIGFSKALMDPASADVAGDVVLEPFEPSDRLELARDARASEVYYFRVTEAAPSAPATDVASVRDRVRADWQRAEAQRLAVEKATAAAKSLAGAGDAGAIGVPLTTVTVGPLRSQATVPAGLDLTLAGYAQFGIEVTEKLLADAGPRPTAALSVPLAGRAYAACRVAIMPEWSTAEELAGSEQAIRSEYAAAMARPKGAANPFGVAGTDLMATWIEPARVFERNAWKPIGGGSE